MMRTIELRMDEAVWERVKRVALDAGINLAEFAQVSDRAWDEDTESWTAIGRQQLLAGMDEAETKFCDQVAIYVTVEGSRE